MSSEHVVAIIESRMGSKRLPGKSLMALAGKPLVERVIERVRQAKSVSKVVVATSVSPKDDPLAAHVASLGVPVCRGSEDDVLMRILSASRANEATIHVQCWGDCPFADPDQIDAVVAALRDGDAHLASNCVGGAPREVPHGLEVVALRRSALEQAEEETRDNPYHREHGTTYLYETGKFRVARAATDADIAFPKLDLTINTAEDYAWVDSIYAKLLERNAQFRIRDLLAMLREDSALLASKNAGALDRGAA